MNRIVLKALMALGVTVLFFVYSISFSQAADHTTKNKISTTEKKTNVKGRTVKMTMPSPTMNASIKRSKIICGAQEPIIVPKADFYQYPSYPGWLRVCAYVQNTTDHAFNSPVGANVFDKTDMKSSSKQNHFHVGNIQSVPANNVKYIGCDKLRPPTGFIEWGHRAPQSGECRARMTVEVILDLDLDLFSDDDPTNDDCTKDNQIRFDIDYMSRCQ